MDDKDRCCGTCRWHMSDAKVRNLPFGEDYVCMNLESEECGDWTDYEYICEHWEVKKNERKKL